MRVARIFRPSPMGEGYAALLARPARRRWMSGSALPTAHPLTQLPLGRKRPSLRNPLPMGEGR
jgi:hypothetical protein